MGDQMDTILALVLLGSLASFFSVFIFASRLPDRTVPILTAPIRILLIAGAFREGSVLGWILCLGLVLTVSVEFKWATKVGPYLLVPAIIYVMFFH